MILGIANCFTDVGVASAEAGMDMAMPNSVFWGGSGEILASAVTNGSIPESRVTDMATRIVAAWYQMGQDVSPLFLSIWFKCLTIW